MNRSALLLLGLGALTLTACVEDTGGSTSVDRRVTIINNTNTAIREFYGSNVGADSWQEDILGADVLPAGRSVTINFDDGSGYCTFDFKAVFVDGSSLVDQNVDVCTTGRVTFH